MKLYDLKSFVKGWFVGNFSPTVIDTSAVEVSIKRYSAGDSEWSHFHRVADEVTVVVDGTIRMNGVEYGRDSVIVIPKGEPTDFFSITDSVTCVVKMPSVPNDKYTT